MSATKNGLKAEEISLIIKACEQARVRVLKYAGLYIEFGRPADAPQVQEEEQVSIPHAPQDRGIAAPATHPAVAEITDIQKRESDKSLLKEELDLKDDQLAEMWITDPYAAEQLVIDGQLEESKNGDDPEEA
jgi:hypothetical protein